MRGRHGRGGKLSPCQSWGTRRIVAGNLSHYPPEPPPLMAKDQTKRVRPTQLQEDRDAHSAIKGFLNPAYTPSNATFSLTKLQAAQDALVAAREAEVQAQADADAARDATVAAEWAYHNAVLGSKDQVKAQYGDNSNEYAAVGLTKKSERQTPGPRATGPTPTPGH